MRYSESIDIAKPRGEVVALFDNPDNFCKWQDGLESFEPLDGASGAPGSRSRLVFQMGSRRIEMIETLEARNLPERFVAIYEADGMWNRNENRFEDLGGSTRWTMECEFRPQSFMLKVLATLAPGMFRKQTAKNMAAFKSFAEQDRP